MNIKILVHILCLATVFLSCKKEPSDNNTIQPETDSSFISKVIWYEDVNGTNISFSSTYEYDGLKRVAAIYDSSTNYGYTDFLYFYNGNDTLPFKRKEIDNDQDSIETFYFYNTQGKKIKDSATISYNFTSDPYQPWVQRHYVYANSAIYEYVDTYDYTNNIWRHSTADTAIIDNNTGNAVSSKYYGWNSSTNNYSLLNSVAYTYDNSANPFYKLSNLQTESPVPHEETLMYESPQRNNRTKISWTYTSNPGNYEFRNVYSYNNDGYVAEVIVTETIPVGIQSYKIKFLYTSLP